MDKNIPGRRRLTAAEFDWICDRAFALAQRLEIPFGPEDDTALVSIRFELLHVFTVAGGIEAIALGRITQEPPAPDTGKGGKT
jgi:hypothetical protein